MASVVAVGVALVAGCSDGQPGPVTSSARPSVTVAPPKTETPAERNARIRQRLIELGCSTNACIQTYFGCADGYITGEACDFYREHPID
ncbi:hypothetical protein OHA40_13945 [Nocardia sp. NBC_00508]|uniref:hypothetical protein n=1 Tax=Nocardia sp. NBC_00508 TaxID=2975992 RepID=UPI002E7FC5A8|nr:hypothetical protein [Nocardia sp. NBC_00508]WUD69127.1 hypothetical protein OHA40_13945 [Nocardia sp. NBC_00508]